MGKIIILTGPQMIQAVRGRPAAAAIQAEVGVVEIQGEVEPAADGKTFLLKNRNK